MKRSAILLDPASGGGGGGNEFAWPATIPPEYEPVIKAKGWKTPFDAVKSYGELEKHVGTSRMEKPQANWTSEKWDAFYKELGRPEKPDGYQFPKDVKLPEGLTIDEAKLNKAREHFHKLGYTPAQAEGALRYYAEILSEAHNSETSGRLSDRAKGESALKQELGDKYDMHVDLAKNVIRQFGGEEFLTFLDQNKLANHPEMVKVLAKIGSAISEDSAKGNGPGLMTGDKASAQKEINKLTNDTEFWKMMNDKHHPGHKDAVDKWKHLHGLAAV